jgi:hypothetical protein
MERASAEKYNARWEVKEIKEVKKVEEVEEVEEKRRRW